jgi:FixJ family two-component response regulator
MCIMVNGMSEPPVIAIVDDDESVRHALATLFRSAGFLIAAFASAEAFLAADDREHIGCLVLDWHMPGMPGLQLQSRLVTSGDPTPIIFLTGHGNEAARAQALAAGAIAFLSKPFDPEALLDAVEATLARRHG